MAFIVSHLARATPARQQQLLSLPPTLLDQAEQDICEQHKYKGSACHDKDKREASQSMSALHASIDAVLGVIDEGFVVIFEQRKVVLVLQGFDNCCFSADCVCFKLG